MWKRLFHTIYIEFAIAAELLHAEDICVLFFHIPGYFFAGISGLISIKGIYVVSGDGECREGGGGEENRMTRLRYPQLPKMAMRGMSSQTRSRIAQ